MASCFITPFGTFAYKVMPFGLKNVGATYQRMMESVFRKQLGKTIEIYIDDMVVKSITQSHPEVLRDIFDILREVRIKLNPGKCMFVISGGKFLGYMVTPRGIEPNPEKVQAVLDLPEPSTRK